MQQVRSVAWVLGRRAPEPIRRTPMEHARVNEAGLAEVIVDGLASDGSARAASAQMAGCPVHRLAAIADAAPAKPSVPAAGAGTDLDEVHFLEQYLRVNGQCPQPRGASRTCTPRWRPRATYRPTADEQTAGAKLAWYNHTRCIAKLYWRSLTARDCRHLYRPPDEIREACLERLGVAASGGNVRPLITIFAPDRPSRPARRVHNAQLVAYLDRAG